MTSFIKLGMKSGLTLVIGFALLVVTASSNVLANTEAASNLSPTKAQEITTQLIRRFMDQYHYKKTNLNDALSEQVFERYLEDLDGNRVYFTQGDIRGFEKFRYKFDEMIARGDLDFPFKVFNRYQLRVKERVEVAIKLLENEFDFDKSEMYTYDRSELPWAKNKDALDEIWRKRVKNDVLSLKLTGKTLTEIRETLAKRYQNLDRAASQFRSEDAYQIFINAYTRSIEPHTSYFSPRTSENFKINMSLSLEGIGAALQTKDEYTVVQKIIKGGPADMSDLLHSEDKIVGVAQGEEGEIVDVVGWRLGDVVELIRGPKGSTVRLQIIPKGEATGDKQEVVTLVRDKIKLEEQAAQKSIIETAFEDKTVKIGVIKVPTFYMDFDARLRGDKNYRSTTRDVRRLIRELEQENVGGIMIDLRGNGGGSLDEATELTGLFIDSGPVVQVKNSIGQIDIKTDDDFGVEYDGPLGILVDRYSASASEIFAGAIQDYQRGVVIGESTFGKGTVQTLVDLNSHLAISSMRTGRLKMTMAQFFRVNGESTQYRGVVPDITFPPITFGVEVGESALDNAIPWARVKPLNYRRGTYFGDKLSFIQDQHQSRVKDNPGFNLLQKEISFFTESTDNKVISLKEEERRAENETNKKLKLDNENEFRVAQGLAAINEDDEEDQDFSEIYDAEKIVLEEAAQVLTDFILFKGNRNANKNRVSSNDSPS